MPAYNLQQINEGIGVAKCKHCGERIIEMLTHTKDTVWCHLGEMNNVYGPCRDQTLPGLLKLKASPTDEYLDYVACIEDDIEDTERKLDMSIPTASRYIPGQPLDYSDRSAPPEIEALREENHKLKRETMILKAKITDLELVLEIENADEEIGEIGEILERVKGAP